MAGIKRKKFHKRKWNVIDSTSGGNDADAQAFFDAHGNIDSAHETAFNNLVVRAKAASIWDKLLALYPMIGSTAAEHKWNAVDPQDADGSFRLTWVDDSSSAHEADGYVPNGTSQYAETHLAPATAINDSLYAFGGWVLTAGTLGGSMMGCNHTGGGVATSLKPRNTASARFAAMNGDSLTYDWNLGDQTGFHAIHSQGYTAQQKFRYWHNHYMAQWSVQAPTVSDEQFTIGSQRVGTPNYYDGKMGMLFIATEMGEGLMAQWYLILHRYYEELSLAAAPPSNFCWFFGDSITERSVGSTGYDNTSNRWIEVFSTAANLTPVNCGIGGTPLRAGNTTATAFGKGMVERLAEIPAYDSNYMKFLVFAFGTNDIFEGNPSAFDDAGFEDDYQTILTHAITTKGWPANRIGIVNCYLTNSTNYDTNKPAANTKISDVATEYSVQLYDALTYMTNNGGTSLLLVDNVHPTSAGQQVIGEGAAAAFTVPA